MDLDTALKAHSEWKTKFRNAIAKKEQLDVATLSLDDRCVLGKWLHGEAKERFGTLKSYVTCLARHAAFHREASKVAAVINEGHMTNAEAMLNAGTPYSAASFEIALAINELRSEAKL